MWSVVRSSSAQLVTPNMSVFNAGSNRTGVLTGGVTLFLFGYLWLCSRLPCSSTLFSDGQSDRALNSFADEQWTSEQVRSPGTRTISTHSLIRFPLPPRHSKILCGACLLWPAFALLLFCGGIASRKSHRATTMGACHMDLRYSTEMRWINLNKEVVRDEVKMNRWNGAVMLPI